MFTLWHLNCKIEFICFWKFLVDFPLDSGKQKNLVVNLHTFILKSQK